MADRFPALAGTSLIGAVDSNFSFPATSNRAFSANLKVSSYLLRLLRAADLPFQALAYCGFVQGLG
jgi:hypothetical protein